MIMTTYIDFIKRMIKTRKIQFKTYKDYEDIIENHFVPFFGDTLVSELDTLIFMEFVDNLSVCIDKIFNLLSMSLKRLYRLDMIDRDIFSYLDKPKNRIHKRKPKRALTIQEINDFLSYLKEHHNRIEPLVALMFASGLRVGEMLALQWNEIEFLNDSEMYIHVNSSYGLVSKGKYGRKEPKTNASIRVVYVNDSYIVRRLKYLKKKSKSKLWVAENSLGTAPVNPNNFNRRYFRLPSKKIGIPISSHYCRVNYISYSLYNNVPMKTIENQVGHTTSDMISKVYAKMTESPRETLKNVHIYKVGADNRIRTCDLLITNDNL